MKVVALLVTGLLSLAVANEVPQEANPRHLRRGLQLDPTVTISGVCFSATMQVQGQNGPIDMQDLRVGDKVLVDSHGKYEPVYAMGHLDPHHHADFMSFRTKGHKKPLEITGEHMVFLQDKPNPVRADSIQVGDMLRTSEDDTGAEVTKITTVSRNGMYAPLTASGSVVVNGMVASTYIAFQEKAPEFVTLSNGAEAKFLSQQKAIHMFFAPYRMLCLGVPFGLGDDLCHARKDGITKFSTFAINFGDSLERQPLMFQIAAFPLLLPLLIMVFGVEMMFGAAFAPMALLTLTGFALLYMTNKRTSKTKSD